MIKALFFIVILFSSTITLFAENCGVSLGCPSGVRYQYHFCILYENGDTEKKFECTDDPLSYEAMHSASYPKISVMKANLPIYPFHDTSYPSGMKYFNKYRDGSGKGIVLFGEEYSEDGNPSDEYPSVEMRESILACEKWNCVCDYETIPSATGTIVKHRFTDNPNDFKTLDPYTHLAVARIYEKLYYKEETDIYYCNFDYNESKIYFNSTPQFLYGLRCFPTDKNTPFKKGWVAQEYLENVKYIPNNVYVFSFLQVAMHELGHMLGFGHYYENSGAEVSQVCDNGGLFVEGVMKYDTKDARKDNITELSQYDKCMFAELYCDDLTSISEYKPINTNIYPNPGRNVVKIEFELESYCKNVTVSIIDGLGRLLLTPIENKQYEIGNHSELINVDSFETGYYYLVIQTETKKSLKPFVVIK